MDILQKFVRLTLFKFLLYTENILCIYYDIEKEAINQGVAMAIIYGD